MTLKASISRGDLIAGFPQLPLDICRYDTYMTRAGWSSPAGS